MYENVAFLVRNFSERGIELSVYKYALYNQEILKNKSVIICFNKTITDKGKKFDNVSRTLFEDKFKVFEIKYIEEITEIITRENISFSYVQSHGFFRDFYKFENKKIWKNCQNTYHYCFGPMIRQASDVRCVIGNHLNKKYKKNLDVLPLIVDHHINYGDLRESLNINKEEFVVGRYGGESTFDIEFVKETIRCILEKRKNITFIFINTKKFINHKKVIFLPKTISLKEKSKFIDTCDVMLHARKDGETFGLAIAEFSSANKPIITYALSKDKEHLILLGKKAILYNSPKDLFDILYNLKRDEIANLNWDCYSKYRPEIVIREFEKICLSKNKKNALKNIREFMNDLPWEILVLLRYFFHDLIYLKILKIIPAGLKLKIKVILKEFKF